MKYEITYVYEGRKHTVYEQPTEGWEDQFLQQVLDRIESITAAGGAVVGLAAIK